MGRNMAQHFAAAARTNVGLIRAGNEDAAIISPVLIAVADGMGGHAGGEVASALAIKGISKMNSASTNSDSVFAVTEIFSARVNEINKSIERSVIENPDLAGMGTTLTALISTKESIAMLHVGDSRCYRLRKNKLMQLSTDHTVIQELLEQGAITEGEIKNHPQRSLLTQALMGRDDLKPQIELLDAKSGDRFLLCSDGLSSVVDEAKIAGAFTGDLQASIDSLIELTYKNGAPDNVTIVAAKIGEMKFETAPIKIGAAS